MAAKAFQLIGETDTDKDPPQTQPAPESEKTGVDLRLLLLALRALSQRTLVAVSNLFTLAAMGSVCWVWSSVLPVPDTYKLTGAGCYSLFVLALEFIRRR